VRALQLETVVWQSVIDVGFEVRKLKDAVLIGAHPRLGLGSGRFSGDDEVIDE
jgi:hypothetical protein